MNDAELSLAVARIMWPDYEWEHLQDAEMIAYLDHFTLVSFNHTTDDALGKMCVWLANNMEEQYIEVIGAELYIMVTSSNPHRAIAEAIVEA